MKKIIFAVLMLILVSCTNKTTPESEKEFIANMTILQEKGEFLQLLGYKGNDGKIIRFAPYFVENAKKIEFKVTKTEQKKDHSTLTVFIKSPDLNYYDNLYPKRLPDENYDDYLSKKALFIEDVLKDKELKFHEKTISVYMIYENGNWILDFNKNNDFTDMVNHKIF